MLSKTPLIITDKNGIIIYCNEAAHNICAAVSFGNSVEDLLRGEELSAYKAALSSAIPSFSVKSSVLGDSELVFDLTKERSDGIRYVHVKNGVFADTTVSYRDIADCFSNAVADARLSKRRFTELYETLAPKCTTFGSGRHLALYALRDLTESFYEHILPNLLSVYGDVTSEQIGITSDSVVYAEPYGLYLTLSAMMSAASYVSAGGGIAVRIEDRGDAVIFEVSASTSEETHSDPIDMFGVHYVDVIYAETLARTSGYIFTYENNRGTPPASSASKMYFTLSVKCRDYYPAYLKAKSSTARCAAVMASLFPFSAKE